MAQTSETSRPDLTMCVLSYFGILALIPYFARKDDPYIRWHARQGLLLAAFMIVLSIGLSLLSWIPVIGMAASLLSALFALAVLALSIYCMIQAYSGQRWEIPGIGLLVK